MYQKQLIFLLIFSAMIVVIGAGALYIYAPNAINYAIDLSHGTKDKVEFTYGANPALSNPDFFSNVKEEFLTQKVSFIEADLSSMIIRVYKDGEMMYQAPIKTKGREGSWWETPAGLYKIQSKTPKHFSSIGHVYQPWSMAFQGNFFIHGWPYYEDGTPVSSQFSGGCVRLADEDAQVIYDAITIGTPVLVFENDFSSDDYVYVGKPLPIEATSYLTADLKNNHVFASKEAMQQVPIASITKLMTALIATEYINLDKNAIVPEEAIVYTSKPRLTAGQEVSVYQLLFPLLMESSNEAAETIARHYGRGTFIKYMNDKAKAIGMTHTTFTDPSGADAGNVSTAEDLFMLAKYIYNNRSFILNLTAGHVTNGAYEDSQWTGITNMNDFAEHPYFFGGKVGKTKAAQETSLTVFKVPVGNDTRPVVQILLGSPERISEGNILLKHTLSSFY